MAVFMVFAAFMALIITKTLRDYLIRRASRIPSASMGWPLLGETLSFAKAHPAFTLGDYLQHHIPKYGKVFWANMYGKWLIHSVDPELNRFVVNNEMKLFVQGWPRSFARLVGSNALTLSLGDAHKRYRSEVLNCISGSKLEAAFLRDMEEIAAAQMSLWKDKSVIVATDETRKYAFYLIAKKALSIAPGAQETEKLMEALSDIYMGISLLPLNIPGTRYHKALQSRGYVQKIIRQKKEERMKRKDQQGCVEEDDLLSYLMNNGSYANQEIGDLVQNFMFGGNEVIGRTLAVAIYYLEGCPKARDQLREERLEAVRLKQLSEGCSKLSANDYKKMDFAQCVINETLRLGTVSRFLHKIATADVEFKGYVIPRGCTVMANLSAMHLDPSEFEEPEKFNPWRWLTPTGVKKSKNFMPFSSGARYCIGAELAKLEIMVFLHHLVVNYDWACASADRPIAVPRLEFLEGLPIKIRPISAK